MGDASKERSTRRHVLRRALVLVVVAGLLLFLGVPVSYDCVSPDGSVTVRVTMFSRYGYVLAVVPLLSYLNVQCRMRVSVIDNASREAQVIVERVRGNPWESYISCAHVLWEHQREFAIVYVAEGGYAPPPLADSFCVDRGPPLAVDQTHEGVEVGHEFVERWIDCPHCR